MSVGREEMRGVSLGLDYMIARSAGVGWTSENGGEKW